MRSDIGVEVAYCRLVTTSTDNIAATNEYRSGVAAQWPFLSDVGRIVQILHGAASPPKPRRHLVTVTACLSRVLTPVSLDKDITAPTVLPTMRLPTGARARRELPTAAFPMVCVPVPAVVAVDPDIFASGCATTFFNHDAWWRDANEHLCCQA
jgi:hypothetical protein